MKQFQEDSPKAEILEAALQEFALHGKQGARMQTIADEAGVNKAMLHYYFTNKDTLYSEVLRRMLFQGLARVYESFDTNLTPMKQMEELIINYFNFFRMNPDLPRLMLWEVTTNPETTFQMFNATIESHEVPFPVMFEQTIRKGIADGDFIEIDAKQYFITILGTVAFYFVGRPILGKVLNIEDEEQFLDNRIKHIKQILLTGVERRK